MKRYLALFCAALLCAAFLTACAQDGGSVPDAPDPSSGAPYTSGTQSALPFPVGTLHILSWNSSEGGFFGCSSGMAYYELAQANVFVDASGNQWEDWLILCTDFKTSVQAPLCSVPGCAHADTSCPAYLRSRGGLENFYIGIVNEQLYVLHDFWFELAERSDAGNQPTVWLEAVAMDGSGRTRLAELPPGWRLSEPFLLTDGTALYGQYGDYSDMSTHGIRVDLESGDYTSFSFGLDDSEDLIGALGNRFVLSRLNTVLPELAYPDIVASQERFRLSSFGYSPSALFIRELVLLDPATGTRSNLNEILQPLAGAPEAFDGFFQQEKFYSITGESDGTPQTLWQSDFAKNECRILAQRDPEQDDGWWSVQGLTLFPASYGIEEPYVVVSYWVDNTQQRFLLDVRSGAIRPIALRYRQAYSGTAPVIPLAQTSDVMWLVQTREMPTDWGRYRFSYALATPETVFSGEGDLYPIQMWTPETPLG